jgi:hypothetical protein
MTFSRLVFTAFSRNRLRSLFTFAAVAAAFCLFGALEAIRYQRSVPGDDEDLVVVQPDGMGGMPVGYEDTILSMPGVKAAVGLTGVPGLNPKSATDQLVIFGVNAEQIPATFLGMKIAPEIAARWRETRIGVLCDERTARDMGWHVNDRVTVQLLPGMTTASGENRLELILLGTYKNGGILYGVLTRWDYLTTAFPQNNVPFNFFVRPERSGDGRALAQRIDQRFRSGVQQTLSSPISDFRESSARDAGTIRMLITGALAISFFTMVLIVANALTQSVRERLGEMAVMQALGFQERTILLLVLAEAFALFAAGAVVGLVLANGAFTFEIGGVRSNSALLPVHTVLVSAAYVAMCTLIAALLPCWELSKLRVADALRRL